MHEAEGDLLIGGNRLKHIHVDLEAEQPDVVIQEVVERMLAQPPPAGP